MKYPVFQYDNHRDELALEIETNDTDIRIYYSDTGGYSGIRRVTKSLTLPKSKLAALIATLEKVREGE